ncbi:hypothetical protein HOLleu_07854 [Holothuria leucospilota]|uniref:Uncharacterized protein n=1 Tax=Holothuria leucospilota TaxID=206669 RepID=A0A9Q1CHY9_HOLLE|nr:hypothetical protein HOLleu_07854 [Holothuria leucospilota]
MGVYLVATGDYFVVTHLPTGDLLPTGDVPGWFSCCNLFSAPFQLPSKSLSNIGCCPQYTYLVQTLCKTLHLNLPVVCQGSNRDVPSYS